MTDNAKTYPHYFKQLPEETTDVDVYAVLRLFEEIAEQFAGTHSKEYPTLPIYRVVYRGLGTIPWVPFSAAPVHLSEAISQLKALRTEQGRGVYAGNEFAIQTADGEMFE